MTRSPSSGWISAWTGLPFSVSRGTPVSSDTSDDAYRNDPAASWTETSALTLAASMRKRCSQGSGAMPLPSTALRCRLGTPTCVLSACERRALGQFGQRAIQLRGRELAEPQALEAVALVRGVERVGSEGEAAHDRGDLLLGEHGEQRQRPAQANERGRGAARALECARRELKGGVVRVEERRVGEVEVHRQLGPLRKRLAQQALQHGRHRRRALAGRE